HQPLHTLGAPELLAAKRVGISDARLGALTGASEAAVRRHRDALGVQPVFKTVDTCAGEFPARTPYHYSTFEPTTEVAPAAPAPRSPLGPPPRARPRRSPAGDHPRCRPEPDRAGDRVRLHMCPRR